MNRPNSLADYMTGKMSEDQAQALEQAVLLGDETFDELLAEETDLLDEYVRAEAPTAVREVLQRSVTENVTLRQRAEFASLLAEFADSSANKESLGVGWRVVGALSVCLALSAGLWFFWGLDSRVSIPPFLLGFLGWISLCGVVLSVLKWSRARVRLRDQIEGLEELWAADPEEENGRREVSG